MYSGVKCNDYNLRMEYCQLLMTGILTVQETPCYNRMRLFSVANGRLMRLILFDKKGG